MNRFRNILQTEALTEYERFALCALADQAARDAGHRLSEKELQAVADDWLAQPEQAQRGGVLCGESRARARRVPYRQAVLNGPDYHWQPSLPARQLRNRRQKP